MSTLSAVDLGNWEQRIATVANLVESERKAQLLKWGIQRHNYGNWLKILVEEVGELSQAMLNFEFPPEEHEDRLLAERIRKEAVQVAAVASAIVQYTDHTEA